MKMHHSQAQMNQKEMSKIEITTYVETATWFCLQVQSKATCNSGKGRISEFEGELGNVT